MYIEISKSQARKTILKYAGENLNTEEFHSLLKSLLHNYNEWYDADMPGLLKPYQKQIYSKRISQ